MSYRCTGESKQRYFSVDSMPCSTDCIAYVTESIGDAGKIQITYLVRTLEWIWKYRTL